MGEYIPKSDLLAEIEKRRESNAKERYFGRLVEDNYFLDFLNTLEVKEVDLEKEFENYMDKYNGVWVDSDYIRFAEHFFALGMAVSNKAQKGE